MSQSMELLLRVQERQSCADSYFNKFTQTQVVSAVNKGVLRFIKLTGAGGEIVL